MRRVALAGLLLLALVFGLLAWRGSAAARARSGVPAAAGAAAPEAPTHPAAGSEKPRDGAAIPVKGQVTDGSSSLCSRDGLLRFRIDDGPEREATIHEGEWEASASRGATLSVEEILFGDRKAVATPATVTVPEDGKVEIVCRWLVPTLLRVIGEKSEDIEKVESYETGDYDDWGPGWPEATPAASPIELAGAEGTHTYLVRAPGYAWSRISVFVGLGGERVVRLVRAGTLDVRLSPFDPEAGITVRVDTDCYWEPDETGRVQVKSLRPGDHEVLAQVRVGGFEVVGEATARVEPGRTTELVLPIRTLPAEPESVPLAGTIEVAPGWTEEDEAPSSCMTPSVSAWSADDSLDIDPPDEKGRWSAGDVRPGTYAFRIDAWTWVQAVDVGPQGARDVRLSVPPPCEVVVRLVDETGEPVPSDGEIAWRTRAAGVDEELLGSFFAGRDGRTEDPTEPGVYRFRAPQGVLSVWYLDEGDSDEPERQGDAEVELKPGLNQVEVKVGWIFCFDVVLLDDVMPVPVNAPIAREVEVAALRGGGAEEEKYTRQNGLRIHVTKPGRYRITFPDIEGYEPIAPVEVDVVAGTIPKIEIALRGRVG
ncbi:MAG TPA: hypothetical protein VFY93_01725 [Planctomycetota bacterium]|nr:hypothetical protein [Planctomycetota bacterium]